VDNVVKLLAPPPDVQEVAKQVVETLPTDTSLALLETLIVGVGLIPVVEEWFFRGVLQQGLVGSLGAAGGVFVTALFFALGHGVSLSVQSWAALVAQTLVLGLVFGYARHKSGSLLAPMLLHVGVNGLGVAALAAPHLIQIPGYNAPGAHTPWWLLALCVTAVAAGVGVLWNETPPPVPIVPATDESDEFEE
jgi:membrane protease YdiL (CAAX protease family)